MKKLILVLGIATLFSCEKYERVCDCYTIVEQKRDKDGATIDSLNQNLDAEWHWVQTVGKESGVWKDLCSKATDWQYYYRNGGTDRQKYICE